ncbi:aminotransferase class V-fold PLP-dependent enzyme [Cellulomonas cellasea]|uniref:Aminotransferase class V n=1 Tax=Cellulomonas cellasea TaxID=43670 RepID=A0A4Y3KZG2_9CELL|nr:aminotransferase class V-fold PLP-dependent enzyme [Cellulomonas cellasea]GEA89871.1 aminotransferase class V [Cellulomonas cellasea]
MPLTTTALADLRDAFAPVTGYLDAATLGLPPRATADALRDALDAWQSGRADAAGYDAAVRRSRAAYARLVGVPVEHVAVGSQTSSLVGVVAAALPDGAEVVVVDGDFTSLVFPFLAHADRGVRVRHVPLDRLAEEVRPGTDLVAFSLVQSRDGRVADADGVRAAAAAVGARTLCDTTQAAGWFPVDAARFDVTVCSAYKWLCGPRGAAFLTVRPEVAATLRPVHAGWYAGADVWSSVYGPEMTLAHDARRFDVSPAWLCWVGLAPALELLAGVDPRDVRAHDAGLADALRARLGLEPTGSAIVALPDATGTLRTRLAEHGVRAAGRAGGVRLAFHVWCTEADVERAAEVVAQAQAGRTFDA